MASDSRKVQCKQGYLGQRTAGGQEVAVKLLAAAAAAQLAALGRLRREVGLMRHVSRDASKLCNSTAPACSTRRCRAGHGVSPLLWCLIFV